jgi:hypothetical protein
MPRFHAPLPCKGLVRFGGGGIGNRKNLPGAAGDNA